MSTSASPCGSSYFRAFRSRFAAIIRSIAASSVSPSGGPGSSTTALNVSDSAPDPGAGEDGPAGKKGRGVASGEAPVVTVRLLGDFGRIPPARRRAPTIDGPVNENELGARAPGAGPRLES